MSIDQLILLKQKQIRKIEEEIKDLRGGIPPHLSFEHSNEKGLHRDSRHATMWEKIRYLQRSQLFNNESADQGLNQAILNKDYARGDPVNPHIGIIQMKGG